MTKKILDELETIPDFLENIDEKSIYEDTGVNYDNVQKRVFSELKLQKHQKMTFKRLMITIIAAVLALSLVSTTVFAALGGFSEVFGELFSGNLNDDNLYTVNYMNFQSDNENLQVNVLGITGDSNTVYAALELSHKDNQPIVSDPQNKLLTYTSGINNLSVNVTETLLQKLTTSHADEFHDDYLKSADGWYAAQTDDDASAIVSVTASDTQTIRLYIKYSRSAAPKGNTMTVKCDGLYEYVPEKLLKTGDNEADLDLARDLSETGKSKIVYNNHKYELWQIRETKLDTNFQLSMKLNYQSKYETVHLSKEAIQKIWHGTQSIYHKDFISAGISFSPLGITMTALHAPKEETNISNVSDVSSNTGYDTSYEVSTGEEISTGYDSFPEPSEISRPTQEDLLRARTDMLLRELARFNHISSSPQLNIMSKIIMEDGTVYHLAEDGFSSDDNKTIVKYVYFDNIDNAYTKPAVIDITKIKKININGFEFDFSDKDITPDDIGTRIIDPDDKFWNAYLDAEIDIYVMGGGMKDQQLPISDAVRQDIKNRLIQNIQSEDEYFHSP